MITCYTFNSITIIFIGCIYSKSLLRHLHMGAGKLNKHHTHTVTIKKIYNYLYYLLK